MICFLLSVCYKSVEMAERLLYVCSDSSLDLFPANTPSAFINKLYDPIILDNKIDYEVALKNIIYPKTHYIPQKNLKICIKYEKSTLNKYIHKIDMSKIIGGDMTRILEAINEDINENLLIAVKKTTGIIIPKNSIVFTYHPGINRVVINLKKKIILPSNITSGYVGLEFDKEGSDMLGFSGNEILYVFTNKREVIFNETGVKAVNPPDPESGINYMLIYSDLIDPINFGDQLVSLLGVVDINTLRSNYDPTMYKPLNKKIIDQVSIKLADQKGRLIQYNDKCSTVCVLHLRPIKRE